MTLGESLENRIRGWIPKEPNMPSTLCEASYANRRTQKIRLPKGQLLICALFAIGSFDFFVNGDMFGLPSLWFSVIIGVLLALDVWAQRSKALNPKLTMAVLLVAISFGGILVNVYAFSVPASFLVRAFSMVMLVVLNVPLLVGVVAVVWGKKELSKKLLNWFVTRRD